jgi:hypothetical protein
MKAGLLRTDNLALACTYGKVISPTYCVRLQGRKLNISHTGAGKQTHLKADPALYCQFPASRVLLVPNTSGVTMIRVVIVGALTLSPGLLSACAPTLVGANSAGGMITNAHFGGVLDNQGQIFMMANGACQPYGEVAQIGNRVSGVGEPMGTITYTCVAQAQPAMMTPPAPVRSSALPAPAAIDPNANTGILNCNTPGHSQAN